MLRRLKGLFCIILSFSVVLTSNTIYAGVGDPYDMEVYMNELYDIDGTYYGRYAEVSKGIRISGDTVSGGVIKVYINGEEVKDYPENTLYDDPYNTYAEGYTNFYTIQDPPINYTNKAKVTLVPNSEIIEYDWGSNIEFFYYFLFINYNLNGYDLFYSPGFGNGELKKIEGIVQNQEITLSNGSDYTRGGYKLVGWSETKDNEYSDPDYSLGQTNVTNLAENGGTAVLFANWKPYTVTYDVNGGREWDYLDSSWMDSNDQLVLEDPSGKYLPQSDFKFAGWKKDKDGTKADFQPNDIIIPSDFSSNSYQMTLYAHWVPDIEEYAIQYDYNDGSNSTFEQKAEVGADVILNNGDSLKREDYEFIGWNTSKDGQGTFYKPGEQVSSLSQTKDDTVTLYAQWRKKSYSITYNSNITGNETEDTMEAIYDKEVQLSHGDKFSNQGYSFKEWNTSKDGKGTSYPGGKTVTNLANIGGNVTLYAIWVKDIQNYTIKYDPNDGSNATYTQLAVVGEDVKLDLGSSLKKDGYTFKGWSTSKDGTTGILSAGATISSLTQNKGDVITLYAVWEKEKPSEDNTNKPVDKPTTTVPDTDVDSDKEEIKDPIIKEDVSFEGNDMIFTPDIDLSKDYDVKLDGELLEENKDYSEDGVKVTINKDVIKDKDTGDYKLEFIQGGTSIIHTVKVRVPSLKIRKLMGRNNSFKLKMLNKDNMKSITWTSKNQKVATVSKNGIIKTKNRIGIATIEADIITNDGYRFKYIIKVDVRERIKNTYNHDSKKIKDTINPTVMLDKELHIRKPVKINFNNLSDKATVKFYSSNSKVAKINKKGYLIGLKKGKKCNIKVVIEQNNYKYVYCINAVVTK